jgi:hypothetical protein
MNSRQRFQASMNFGKPDRVPLFEEGIRDEVLDAWHSQGWEWGDNLADLFIYDRREEIEPDLNPMPYPRHWPTSIEELPRLKKRLKLDDPRRMPESWQSLLHAGNDRDILLFLRVNRGFFLSMGVEGWGRFTQVMELLVDDPDFVHASLALQGDFAARMAEKILSKVRVDGAIFSEPIGGNHGPLISPRMYESFVLKNYQPLIEVLRRFDVQTVIMRTYANTRVLLPATVKAGFNCLWAHECSMSAMDYRVIRAEFGRDLRLIGGIDTNVLRRSKEAIRRELEEKVPDLLDSGGYIPLANSRVREEIPFENYIYYRRHLEKIVLEHKQ